ncbi:ATP-binding protein [Gillisia sp. M10.2A]|uniref:histidine kinase n=1 Tax=Gillisia lutea TaxID=2909668 RepID=A0ABS9ELQ6_9FLAO|nr:ATP-binding protein [Gillisia lutea]MCF4102735.1 ATP-binding protein [Gillisia lutea]
MGLQPRVYPQKIDVTNCDREPIHIIGKSLAHGVIVVCEASSLKIVQCTNNIQQLLGFPLDQLLNNELNSLLPKEIVAAIEAEQAEGAAFQSHEVLFNGKKFIVIPHISGSSLLLDIEPAGDHINPILYQQQLSKILNEINASQTVKDIGQQAVALVKYLYDYDRVMLYQFDEDWNGEVVAEVKNKDMNSWLGLHYPATDIPKPARESFLKQGIRIISDVYYEAAPLVPQINPFTNLPVDLSKSELRAVSPIHIEYLKNMEVGASLTAAIILNGQLWGLMACHHNTPKFISYHQRQSCKFLTQVVSNQLALKTANTFLEKKEESSKIRKRLVHQMNTKKNLCVSLIKSETKFTDLLECDGGALVRDGVVYLYGETPTKTEVKQIVEEVLNKKDDVLFSTKHLSKELSEAFAYKDVASGLLSIKLGNTNKDYLMWFRPEILKTVHWGGNPEKKAEIKDGVQYLSPRKSFERWSQEVSGVSKAWEKYDLQGINYFRENLLHFILQQQQEEIKQLNRDLLEANKELETFSYSVSHDLRVPLRGIHGYARILKEDYLGQLNETAKKAVQTIIKSAEEMEILIEDILSYSGVGQGKIKRSSIGVQELSLQIVDFLNVDKHYPKSTFKIDKNIPNLHADKRMLYQLLSNLISNAFKYSDKVDTPIIEVGFLSDKNKIVYFVKDNGVGFNPKMGSKIFEVFTRLVDEEFGGSGIGLAIAKKVVEKHNGEIWFESAEGKGATFYFTLDSNIE